MMVERPRYRPALDGGRGVFVVGFMAYHFGLSELAGMWVVINHFFILSAFLIVRLLVAEHERYGGIDVVGFYQRRVRRLLPALLVLLGVVSAYGAVFLEGGARRRLGGDVLATLGYVMNWRLVLQSDDYFGDQGGASPLRHAWTLAIEEQFYLVVPVVLLALLAVARRRRAVVVGVLLAGALLSAAWTASLGFPEEATHARVYYGTDARAQALFLGAALGAWRAPHPSGRSTWTIPRWVLEMCGVLGLAASLLCFFWVTPYTTWMFTGPGQLLFGIGSCAFILSGDDRRQTVVSSLFSWRPLAWTGRRTYGLYLWHWPIFVALSPLLGRSGPAIFVVAMVLTFVVADISYRYLEKPVMAKGIRALVPRTRRPVLLWLAPVAALAAVGVGLSQTGPPAQADVRASGAPSLESVPQLVEGQSEYAPGSPARIAVHGDSVPYYLVQRLPATTFPGVRVDNLAGEGCDLLDEPISYAPGLQKATEPWCRDLKEDWPGKLAAQDDQVFVIFASPLTAMPHIIDGERRWIDDPALQRTVTATLEELRAKAIDAGAAQVQVVNVPCRVMPKDIPDEIRAGLGQDEDKLGELRDPKIINRLIDRWAAQHDVGVVDLYGALCADGFRDSVAGIPLYNDFLHYSPEATPMIWRWLLGQVSASYATADGPSAR